MRSHATIVLVRPDPVRTGLSRADDVEFARSLGPPCWVLMLGGHRTRRLRVLRSTFGLDGIAKDGLNVLAPVQISWERADHPADRESSLPSDLALYLVDVAFWQTLARHDRVEFRLPADVEAPLVAAVAEAVAVHPQIDLFVGELSLESSLRWELRRDRFQTPPTSGRNTDIIGASHQMKEVERRIALYADLPYPVLILGETGTGKELVAKALHEESGRQGSFMPVNAAQLPPELAESLLFGHERGSFTGAVRDRQGRIREAEGGTFFLDEAFDLHPAVQAKLLRAFNRTDEGLIVVEPLGSTKRIIVRSRLIVAAQHDPRVATNVEGQSRMRKDLFFRVAVGVIELPPLRERLGDLSALCRHLLPDAIRTVSDDGLAELRLHDWPGNVRELRLVLLRAMIDGPNAADELSGDAVRSSLRSVSLPSGMRSFNLPCNLERELKRAEVETLRAALRASGGNQTAAGRSVGMGNNSKNFKRRLGEAESRLVEKQDDK